MITDLISITEEAKKRKKISELLLLLEDIYGHSPDPVIYPGMTINRYSSSVIETNQLKSIITRGWLDGIITDEEHSSLVERYLS